MHDLDSYVTPGPGTYNAHTTSFVPGQKSVPNGTLGVLWAEDGAELGVEVIPVCWQNMRGSWTGVSRRGTCFKTFQDFIWTGQKLRYIQYSPQVVQNIQPAVISPRIRSMRSLAVGLYLKCK